MTRFPSDDFLLETKVARDLYVNFARDLPIIDYHSHLSPRLMASNHKFRSITEIWLEGDHYKWRAMRAAGVPERLITGDAPDWEKFEAWAKTVPATLGNPLFHWTAMELRKPFGVTEALNAGSARAVFDRCNEQLQTSRLTALGILREFHVAVVCTTDDPADDLGPHRQLAARQNPVTQVYPTWRPDRALALGGAAEWNQWIALLEHSADFPISGWQAFLEALDRRHAAFHELGCRASDHGLERMYSAEYTDAEASVLFDRLRGGAELTPAQAEVFRSALLHRMALLDHARGWAQQFHLGALRNVNTRMRNQFGADAGCDSIGDFDQVQPLARYLDCLDRASQLPRTIIYNVNPAFNASFATIAGSFADPAIPGKIQWGSAWWFLDQLDGIEAQLRTLAHMGLLSQFIGMVTDSRSFLSFPRHDYFRRVLCNVLGNDVRRGRLPDDLQWLGNLVLNVGFRNARRYFGFITPGPE